MSLVALSQIFVYPLKSASGIALPSSKVVTRGLEHDRRWMVVDPTGMLVTLRERPDLAHITTTLVGACLRLEAPGTPPLTLPLELPTGTPTIAIMWTTPVDALVVEEATAWVSTFLEGDYRLVYMPEASYRNHDVRADTPLSFVDGNPLSLISEASLADLNGRLETPVDLRTFRHNLIVSGCAAYAEDDWETLQIGELRLERLGPCVRCMLINVDLATGTHGREPLRTLARYRRVGQEVHFGVLYRIVGGISSTLTCGDALTLNPTNSIGDTRGAA